MKDITCKRCLCPLRVPDMSVRKYCHECAKAAIAEAQRNRKRADYVPRAYTHSTRQPGPVAYRKASASWPTRRAAIIAKFGVDAAGADMSRSPKKARKL